MSIKSINKLSWLLGFPRPYLSDLSNRRSLTYRTYKKLKRSSLPSNPKYRLIDNPSEEIKRVQRKINNIILKPEIEKLPRYMHGAIPGRSSRTNAIPHLCKEAVFSIDLENFFPSVKPDRVYKMFREKFECSPEVAKILTRLTTRSHKLPQGSPTSPSICNLVLESLCDELYAICEEHECVFSQYVDDMFISGRRENIICAWKEARRAIETAGYRINFRKCKLSMNSDSQNAAGVNLNKKNPSVLKAKRRKIEREIMRLSQYDEYDCF